jgi:hypothetical protein
MARVPDTNNFTLRDVVNIIGGAVNSLRACFTNADPDLFDPAYEGDKDRLSNFRNYGSDEVVEYSDYSLPTAAILMSMWYNLKSGIDQNNDEYTPVGNLADAVYWASQWYSPTQGYIIVFTTGDESHSDLTNISHVRAVRSFTSSAIYSLRDIGLAGGYIFFITPLGGGYFTYYEASPEDLAASNWEDASAACSNLVVYN